MLHELKRIGIRNKSIILILFQCFKLNFDCQTLSGYSDLILFVADRGEVPRGSAEIFFRKVKFWEDGELQEAPPVFVGIIFLNQEESMY